MLCEGRAQGGLEREGSEGGLQREGPASDELVEGRRGPAQRAVEEREGVAESGGLVLEGGGAESGERDEEVGGRQEEEQARGAQGQGGRGGGEETLCPSSTRPPCACPTEVPQHLLGEKGAHAQGGGGGEEDTEGEKWEAVRLELEESVKEMADKARRGVTDSGEGGGVTDLREVGVDELEGPAVDGGEGGGGGAEEGGKAGGEEAEEETEEYKAARLELEEAVSERLAQVRCAPSPPPAPAFLPPQPAPGCRVWCEVLLV